MENDGLRVDISHVDGLATVAVEGEIDLSTAGILGCALDELEPSERVLVDLAGVDFMDSRGLISPPRRP